MNIRYKLTKQDLTTYNGFQWELNRWESTGGQGDLCSNGWLHCYSNPVLAILLNCLHADIENPRLFEVEVDGQTLNNKGLKEGWTRMRLVKEIEIPTISIIQKTAFSILCALEVYKEDRFVEWANNWLNDKNRSEHFDLLYHHGGHYVEYAYRAANCAFHAAARFTEDVRIRENAANAAYYASYIYSAYSDNNLDFGTLIQKAMEIK